MLVLLESEIKVLSQLHKTTKRSPLWFTRLWQLAVVHSKFLLGVSKLCVVRCHTGHVGLFAYISQSCFIQCKGGTQLRLQTSSRSACLASVPCGFCRQPFAAWVFAIFPQILEFVWKKNTGSRLESFRTGCVRLIFDSDVDFHFPIECSQFIHLRLTTVRVVMLCSSIFLVEAISFALKLVCLLLCVVSFRKTGHQNSGVFFTLSVRGSAF